MDISELQIGRGISRERGQQVDGLVISVEPEDLAFLTRLMNDLAEYTKNPDSHAHNQALGIHEHLLRYARGQESEFRRYFAVIDPHHERIHQALLKMILPEVTELSPISDRPTSHFIALGRLGMGLEASIHSHNDGSPFGVMYEGVQLVNGHTLPTVDGN